MILRETARIVRDAAAARDRRDAARLRLRLRRRRPLERARAGDARAPPGRPRRVSARAHPRPLRELTGRDVAVVVTDSFGRPFRQGTTDVAIGVAGLRRSSTCADDRPGRLRAAREPVAVADEIAAAADLVARRRRDGCRRSSSAGVEAPGDGTAASW